MKKVSGDRLVKLDAADVQRLIVMADQDGRTPAETLGKIIRDEEQRRREIKQ